MTREISFYTDEHVGRTVVSGLRSRGVDVLTAVEAKMLSAPDSDHLALATRESRVIFTQDIDFLRLHADGSEHAGIVYAPQGMPPGAIIRGLMLIYQVLTADEMWGQVEYLSD